MTAAPERGKANAAVVALLARELEVARSAIRITAGETSPQKTVEIDVDADPAAKLGRP